MQLNSSVAGHYSQLLPEDLRFHPGNPHQMGVYEEFSQNPSRASSSTLLPPPHPQFIPQQPPPTITTTQQQKQHSQSTQQQIIQQQSPSHLAPFSSAPPPSASSVSSSIANSTNPFSQLTLKFTQLLSSLDTSIRRNRDTHLPSLPPTHELVALIRQTHISASQYLPRDEFAIWFGEKVLRLLYQTDAEIGIDIYIILLERMCELSKNASKEVIAWLLYSTDARKFNVSVTCALIQSGLINVVEFDRFMGNFLSTGRADAVKFCLEVVLSCLDMKVATHIEFHLMLLQFARFVLLWC